MAYRSYVIFLVCLLTICPAQISFAVPPAGVAEPAAWSQEPFSPYENAGRQRAQRFSEGAVKRSYEPPSPISEMQLREKCSPKANYRSKAMFYGKSLRARVLDRTSLEPVEGALVLASWGTRRTDGLDGQPPFRGLVYAVETRTDKEGHFEIPSWGPFPLIHSQDSKLNWWSGNPQSYVRTNPYLVIYKQGYVTRLGEAVPSEVTLFPQANKSDLQIGEPVLTPNVAERSEYDGKDIMIGRPWPASDERSEQDTGRARASVGTQLFSILMDYANVDSCAWQRFKHALKVVVPNPVSRDSQQYLRLEAAMGDLLRCDEVRVKLGCESIRDFLIGAK